MFSIFRHLEKLRQPAEHDTGNFCALIDEELHEDPQLSAQVAETVHYKEVVSPTASTRSHYSRNPHRLMVGTS
jgi:hypothetical protein